MDTRRREFLGGEGARGVCGGRLLRLLLHVIFQFSTRHKSPGSRQCHDAFLSGPLGPAFDDISHKVDLRGEIYFETA